jgi:hypothetical protein
MHVLRYTTNPLLVHLFMPPPPLLLLLLPLLPD